MLLPKVVINRIALYLGYHHYISWSRTGMHLSLTKINPQALQLMAIADS
jgi:hypothetical protein